MERRKKKLTGSTAAKITAYFLMAAGFVMGAIGIVGSVIMYTEVPGSRTEMIREFMWGTAMEDFEFTARSYLYSVQEEEWLEDYFSRRNSSVEIFIEDKRIWSCYNGEETPYMLTYYGQVPGRLVRDGQVYRFESGEADGAADGAEDSFLDYSICLYVDDAFPIADSYRTMEELGGFIYDMRNLFPGIGICGILALFISFIFLMCGAGHKNGAEGIVPSVISELPLDFVTLAFGFVAVAGIWLFVIFSDESFLIAGLAFLIVGMLETVWCTLYCMEFATRLKLGKFWRNTLVYMVLHYFVKGIKWIFRSITALIRGIPLVWNVVIGFFAVCIAEMLVCLLTGWSTPLFLVWFCEKVCLFPVVLYLALMFKKVQQGSEALAEGNLNYQIDTSGLLLGFKKHGENLNRIGQGISLAVEERMRSERLKTELITNVSHDLKTPLTSIINYAELLGNEGLEREKVSEYAQVLLRQSKRLKKLLEDLVEASKATTGNLDVNPAPCEISVILSQAVGEYEQRFAQRGLELIIRQPQEAVTILADGRHLWRIFDNLMNNIDKYAQENTRVYLSVEKKGNDAEIIFRNMSKYVLDTPGEELQERFVRGDKSRHMEGNGLGLSIAKSLAELQNGSLGIVTDGDLFKVILCFPVLALQEESA